MSRTDPFTGLPITMANVVSDLSRKRRIDEWILQSRLATLTTTSPSPSSSMTMAHYSSTGNVGEFVPFSGAGYRLAGSFQQQQQHPDMNAQREAGRAALMRAWRNLEEQQQQQQPLPMIGGVSLDNDVAVGEEDERRRDRRRDDSDAGWRPTKRRKDA